MKRKWRIGRVVLGVILLLSAGLLYWQWPRSLAMRHISVSTAPSWSLFPIWQSAIRDGRAEEFIGSVDAVAVSRNEIYRVARQGNRFVAWVAETGKVIGRVPDRRRPGLQ
jgi:hypothetical protein